ncbi:trace amine-associated receptor 6 [Exaiptasia diaphana]|uniref:G-protein coupled receptors family 1 profile domain-containing protein n=1 Tax=Exaiptasia diaphana TaxID=2652724 RepID=A0A913Y9M8_EXADI|nr:trace amine-associated receptor 6 [Exaiptasia diaphana]
MNDTECLIKEKSFPFIILAVLCSLSGLVAVFGNVLVLLAIYTTRSLRTTSNLFIASLAASDLLVGSIMDPILAVRTIRYSYLGKQALTDPHHPFKVAIDFLWIQAVVVTTFGLMAVSVDRYVAITKVFVYEAFFTTKHCIYLISIVWLFSFLLASLRLYVPVSNIGALWVAIAVISCGIPFSVTLYCYFGIFRAARKQLKRIVNETTTKTSKETRRLEEARHRKTAWTIGIVIALFFFLWFPSLVVAAVNLTLPDGCKKTYFAQTVWIWIEWIAYLSSAVNPWVYSMRSAEFRTACKLSLGLQRARVIPEEMISRSKARPSVIDNAGIPGVASINLSTNTLNGYPTSKRSDDKNSNYLLPPVS